MKKMNLIFIIPFILFSGCLNESEDTNEKRNPELVGVWVTSAWENDHVLYTRATKFKDDEGGYQFKADGTLIDRKNAGWCGTPPITYDNFAGTWDQNEDTILVKSGSWNGETSCKLVVISVDSHFLKVKMMY